MTSTDNTAVIRRLEAENERLRAALEHYAADYDYELGVSQGDGGAKAREALYCDDATAIAQETGQYDEWRTHDSHEPPDDMAPAQLIWEREPTMFGMRDVGRMVRVDSTAWFPGVQYRPALSADGLPLCSADGLEPWARYVFGFTKGVKQTASSNVRVDFNSYGEIFVIGGEEWTAAPETHCKPGPASESLMEVHRD